MRKTDHQTDRKERKAVRAAGRKRTGDLPAVLFFLLLLPYTCSMVSGVRQEEAVETAGTALRGQGGAVMRLERENGVWQVPLEEYLVGVLAACMPGEYREEALKAQAVILRSICRAEGTGADAKETLSGGQPDGSGVLPQTDGPGVLPQPDSPGVLSQPESPGVLLQPDGGLAYLDEGKRRDHWGADWEALEEKFSGAVKETEGLVLTWQGETVSPPFFRVSAGKTRDAAQIWGEGTLSWCRSTDCAHDIEAEAFLQEKRLPWETFLETLEGGGMTLPRRDARIKLIRDSAGYVLTVESGSTRMGGERFRRLFELPSACFELQEENGEVLLRTKGVGHGLGFDQYAADLLAAEGRDYMQILDAFFEGLTLEKME